MLRALLAVAKEVIRFKPLLAHTNGIKLGYFHLQQTGSESTCSAYKLVFMVHKAFNSTRKHDPELSAVLHRAFR
jgi:hypothetical protein